MCGTDINFVRDWPDDPMALGHEIAAEVIEVGKNVTSVKPGDTVIVEDVTMCGICDDCKSGHPEFCRNMYSIEGQPGMGQYMSVRYNSLDKFEGLDYVIACLTEPLAVALTAVLNAEIPLGGSRGRAGPGPAGADGGAGWPSCAARASSPSPAPAATPARAGARWTPRRKFGCDMVIEVGKQDVEEEIKRRLPERRRSGDRQRPAAEHVRRVQGHPLRRDHHLLRACTSAARARSSSTSTT